VSDLEQWYVAIYPESQSFVDSTATARLNGYLGGNGTLEQLQAEIDSYGLSLQAKEKLLDILSARWGETVRQACPLVLTPDGE
jgi:peptide-methionine (S)-S-oxide reductase